MKVENIKTVIVVNHLLAQDRPSVIFLTSDKLPVKKAINNYIKQTAQSLQVKTNDLDIQYSNNQQNQTNDKTLLGQKYCKVFDQEGKLILDFYIGDSQIAQENTNELPKPALTQMKENINSKLDEVEISPATIALVNFIVMIVFTLIVFAVLLQQDSKFMRSLLVSSIIVTMFNGKNWLDKHRQKHNKN